jgi:hypothetical protein
VKISRIKEHLVLDFITKFNILNLFLLIYLILGKKKTPFQFRFWKLCKEQVGSTKESGVRVSSLDYITDKSSPVV